MMIIYRCVLVRTLLDRYATCSSSKDVVKAQDKWLEEMEEEQNAQSSQGFYSFKTYLCVYFVCFKVFLLLFTFHLTPMSDQERISHYNIYTISTR